MDELIKQIEEHSHYTEEDKELPFSVTDGMSIEEMELQRRFPDLYERRVNGIRQIHVRDGSQETRYRWEDGKLIYPEDRF